jgi:hypothetical protein
MAHALLDADQHVDEGLLASTSLNLPGHIDDRFFAQTHGPHGLTQLRESQGAPIELNKMVDKNFLTVEAHLSRAQDALEHLARYEQRVDSEKKFSEEMNWLAANKRRFAGRWIALEGAQLLVVGNTSREVFSQLPDNATPPLVIRIDEENLPFAGW